MAEVFTACGRFRPVDTPPEISSILSDFERDFLAQGKATHRLAFQLA